MASQRDTALQLLQETVADEAAHTGTPPVHRGRIDPANLTPHEKRLLPCLVAPSTCTAARVPVSRVAAARMLIARFQ